MTAEGQYDCLYHHRHLVGNPNLPFSLSSRNLVAVQWAGFSGVVGCLLRNRTVTAVSWVSSKTDKTCPYTSLIPLMVGTSRLSPKLSTPELLKEKITLMVVETAVFSSKIINGFNQP